MSGRVSYSRLNIELKLEVAYLRKMLAASAETIHDQAETIKSLRREASAVYAGKSFLPMGITNERKEEKNPNQTKFNIKIKR